MYFCYKTNCMFICLIIFFSKFGSHEPSGFSESERSPSPGGAWRGVDCSSCTSDDSDDDNFGHNFHHFVPALIQRQRSRSETFHRKQHYYVPKRHLH